MTHHTAFFTKRICCTVIAILTSIASFAQLADGATAPDFTFTDINGTVQNLYTYLNEGKYVAIDISATWCVPCWDYHNTHVLDSLYALHDAAGDNTWKVIFIEGDASTDSANLHGAGPRTEGDWVTGTGYTIIDPAAGTALTSFLSDYNVVFFPMLYLICPGKKILQDTLYKARPDVAGWEFDAANLCATTGITSFHADQSLTIYPNPATGAVTLHLESDKTTNLTLSIINYLGQTVAIKALGYLYSGEHSIQYDASRLSPGLYFFRLAGMNFNAVTTKVFIQ